MNNTEKIRELLTKDTLRIETKQTVSILDGVVIPLVAYDQALSLLPKPDSAEPSCDNCRMRKTCVAKGELCNDYSKDETLPTYQTTSVLPKQPCERCGGEKHIPSWPVMIPCPACGALHQNGTGQAPAGEVEIANKETFEDMYANDPRKTAVILFDSLMKTCEEFEAQAKQIKKFEDGAFAANEEAQARNDQIKRLEAEKKDLEWGINITGNSVKVIMSRVNELKALQKEAKE